MSNSYYIDEYSRIWIKDDIAPNGTNVYRIKIDSGYTPNIDKIFDYADDFNDEVINFSKWFTSGTGTVEEVYGYSHISATSATGYPKLITTPPIKLLNQVLEYKIKLIGISSESCTIGYTSYYNTSNLNWYLYIDSNRYIRLWTRQNGTWGLRWTSPSQVILGSWYKFRFIFNSDGIKFYLLKVDESVILSSSSYLYDDSTKNSLYLGNKSTGDESYIENFIIRKYYSNDLNVNVYSEVLNTSCIVTVHNTSENEYHKCQFDISSEYLGSINQSTSLNISTLYKSPLKNPYYSLYDNCVMYIPNIDEDIINNHNITLYNYTNTVGRFNDNLNSTYFNGINTRGVITNTDYLNIFNYNNFTLNIWIKQLKDYSNDYCAILSKAANTSSNTNRWRLLINSNNIGFTINDYISSYNFMNFPNPIKINDNKWHLLTFVRNGYYLYAYKDAQYTQLMTLMNITNFTNTNNLDIGCMYNIINYDKYLQANLGEISLYTVSWDSNNILKYYNLTESKHISNNINVNIY